jgi:hypothetical protein
MNMDQTIGHLRPRAGSEKQVQTFEFARRHKITVTVAAAILANAKNVKDADKAVGRMRGS